MSDAKPLITSEVEPKFLGASPWLDRVYATCRERDALRTTAAMHEHLRAETLAANKNLQTMVSAITCERDEEAALRERYWLELETAKIALSEARAETKEYGVDRARVVHEAFQLRDEIKRWEDAASVLPGCDTPRSPQDLMDAGAELKRLQAEVEALREGGEDLVDAFRTQCLETLNELSDENPCDCPPEWPRCELCRAKLRIRALKVFP